MAAFGLAVLRRVVPACYLVTLFGPHRKCGEGGANRPVVSGKRQACRYDSQLTANGREKRYTLKVKARGQGPR